MEGKGDHLVVTGRRQRKSAGPGRGKLPTVVRRMSEMGNFGQLIEHFVVLPARWFRLHCHTWRDMRQRCKVCGCRDKFNFYVPDELWEKVVPPRYRNRVVCLACFDDFAKQRGVDYATSLKTLYFAGDGACLELGVMTASEGR